MQNVPLLKKKEATIFLNIFLFQLLACQIKFQVKVAKIQGQSSTCSFATTEPNLCVLVVRLKVNPKAKALDQYTIKSQAVAHLGQQHPLKVQKFNSSTPWLVAHLPWYCESSANNFHLQQGYYILLKVSKFRKHIFLFSFEPKTNIFFSALRI